MKTDETNKRKSNYVHIKIKKSAYALFRHTIMNADNGNQKQNWVVDKNLRIE